MTDFRLIAHGSVWTVTAVSDDAKEFAQEHFPVEGWQGTPEEFTTDWRAASNLSEQLQADGFVVEYL